MYTLQEISKIYVPPDPVAHKLGAKSPMWVEARKIQDTIYLMFFSPEKDTVYILKFARTNNTPQVLKEATISDVERMLNEAGLNPVGKIYVKPVTVRGNIITRFRIYVEPSL